MTPSDADTPRDYEALAESHLDLRNAPPGHATYHEPELPASEWRAAYFVLARIALEQLDDCRATLDAERLTGAVMRALERDDRDPHGDYRPFVRALAAEYGGVR